MPGGRDDTYDMYDTGLDKKNQNNWRGSMPWIGSLTKDRKEEGFRAFVDLIRCRLVARMSRGAGTRIGRDCPGGHS
jgi:hypothetical protein